MRIAINARFLLPQLEGIGVYTCEIVSRMAQANPGDQFLLYFDSRVNPKTEWPKNVHLINTRIPARHPLLFALWYERVLPFYFRKHKPDVFFSPDGFCSFRSEVPTVMTIHDLAYLHDTGWTASKMHAYYRKWMPKYIDRADGLVTVSNFTAADIWEHFDVKNKPLIVAYNGIRDGFTPLAKEEKRQVRDRFLQGNKYFLYSGAMHPRKNLTRLIRAFDLFKRQQGSEYKLLLTGRKAWMTHDLEQAWLASHYRDDILFTGYTSDQDLQQLMGAAEALVYISLFEGFGIPIVEAMKSGTAVICSRDSAMSEVAGEAALLADPYSVDDVAQKMTAVATEEQLRLELIEKGSSRIKKFSWDESSEKIYQLLKKTGG